MCYKGSGMARGLLEKKSFYKLRSFYDKTLLASKEKSKAKLESPKLPEKILTKRFGELKLAIYYKMSLFSKSISRK